MSETAQTAEAPPEAFEALDLSDPEEQQKFIKNFTENGRTFQDMTALTPESMEVLYMVAYNHYNGGKYEDAEKVFRLLCLLNHFELKFWKGLAACRENMKDHEGAVQAYGYLTIMDMKDPYPPFHGAKNLLALGRIDEAKSGLQAAIVNSANDPSQKELHEQAVGLLDVVEKNEAKIEEASETEGASA